jgi:hypothetical protein
VFVGSGTKVFCSKKGRSKKPKNAGFSGNQVVVAIPVVHLVVFVLLLQVFVAVAESMRACKFI